MELQPLLSSPISRPSSFSLQVQRKNHGILEFSDFFQFSFYTPIFQTFIRAECPLFCLYLGNWRLNIKPLIHEIPASQGTLQPCSHCTPSPKRPHCSTGEMVILLRLFQLFFEQSIYTACSVFFVSFLSLRFVYASFWPTSNKLSLITINTQDRSPVDTRFSASPSDSIPSAQAKISKFPFLI